MSLVSRISNYLLPQGDDMSAEKLSVHERYRNAVWANTEAVRLQLHKSGRATDAFDTLAEQLIQRRKRK